MEERDKWMKKRWKRYCTCAQFAVWCRQQLTWNQSMVQQLTREGNCLNRLRKVSPMGLIASTTWSWSRTRSMNRLKRDNGVPSVCLDFSRILKMAVVPKNNIHSHVYTFLPIHNICTHVQTSLLVNLPHLVTDLVLLVHGEHVRDLPSVEQVTDVLQKALFLHLHVREEEHSMTAPLCTLA